MFTGTLLPYQPEAVDKMCERGSMLIAYDLGLGKTVITIAALERLKDEKKVNGPGLIICLSSLKYQWASQITHFTDTSVPVVIDGSPAKRALLYQDIIDGKISPDYIILNYEQVVNDWSFVSKLPRNFVVLDEATAIKSFKSKRAKHIKNFNRTPYRFALTGTPIENGKPEELYSIMQFVDPNLLGRFDVFDRMFIIRNSFGWVDGYRNLPTLHDKLKPVTARKAQSDPDVAPHLPATIHKDPLFVPFDRAGSKVYKRIVDDLLLDLEEIQSTFGADFNLDAHYGVASTKAWAPSDEIRGKIMSKVTALRMLCSHPDLLTISAEKFAAMSGEGSSYAFQLQQEGLLANLSKAPKLEMLVSYVRDFLDQNPENKVVIFSSYIGMVHKIVDALGKDICVPYTGELDAKTKDINKTRLNTDPSIRVLVSSDAGGYGVDLPAANLLINYDLPWSSGAASQRNGRIRRASSKWPSIVIQDILVSGSIEQRQHEVLSEKTSVASAIIDGEGFDDDGALLLTAGSLNSFLQSSYV